MMEVIFDIDGRFGSLSAEVAAMIAENLRRYDAGQFSKDVAVLGRGGIDPVWLDGARAMADAIEDVLTGVRDGPIPLDACGLAANALRQALRLTGPACFHANSEHAVLVRKLRPLRTPGAPL